MSSEPNRGDIVEFGPSDEKAWMVDCPPTDECDYRVYFTRTDAEVADEMFRDECLTDEDDADRRTQGVSGLVQASAANARIRALREQVADQKAALGAALQLISDLTAQRDAAVNGLLAVAGFHAGGSTGRRLIDSALNAARTDLALIKRDD